MNQSSPHPLGTFAALAAEAQEWHSRERGLGGTWAGLWLPSQQDAVLATVAAQAQPLDETTRTMLARQAALPGVRDYRMLYALLPYPQPDSLAEEHTAEQLAAEDAATEDTATEDAPTGLPIWHHGTFEQARLTASQHAIHLVRYLDDFHEPTVAAMRRYRLRALAEASPEQQAAACQEVADAFLEQPTRWRDVVETAVHLAAVRACEELLGQRIKGPGRTTLQLRLKLDTAIVALALSGAGAMADAILAQLASRREHLAAAKVVLIYQEHSYLHLSGIQAGRSVRKHLPRGLHLIFSSQDHRRADRIVDAWLAQSGPDQSIGAYHIAGAIPPAYAAARPQRQQFRLPDANAVRRYLARPAPDELP